VSDLTERQQLLDNLKRPFADNEVESRPGPKRKRGNKWVEMKFSYIPEPYVRQRLDEVLPLAWSWEVKEYKIYQVTKPVKGNSTEETYLAEEIAILGRLTLYFQDGTSVFRDAWGGSSLAKGSQEGDSFKIADSNAFKKAALKFGIGSYLAVDLEKHTESTEDTGPYSANPFTGGKTTQTKTVTRTGVPSAAATNPFLS